MIGAFHAVQFVWMAENSSPSGADVIVKRW